MSHPTITTDGNYLTMPGLATVHSHAFQRAIRGVAQRKSSSASSFWSWRNLMYRLAEQLDPESMYAVARLAYLELALSGVTLVGEFHYVHHQPDGTPYDNRIELAEACIRAAKDVGIRICLIRTAYMRGGYQQEMTAAQRRFSDPAIDLILHDVELLQARYEDDPLVSIGVAAHSIRAVPLWANCELAAWAHEKQRPFHMHVCEQRRELIECQAEHGVTPLQLLADNGILSQRFVGIHATHLNAAEIAHLGHYHCFVGLCRTTERDLGDGLPETAALVAADVKLCVGVDSHCCGNAFEEIRAIELDARSQHEARTVVGNADFLLDLGTRSGYAACGFEAVWQQDQVLLDANDWALLGLLQSHVVDGVIFNATPRAVKQVRVNGKTIIENGHHLNEVEIRDDYLQVTQNFLTRSL